MPETKKYEGKKKHGKRRPHHEMESDEINTEAVNEGIAEATLAEDATGPAETIRVHHEESAFAGDSDAGHDFHHSQQQHDQEAEKVHLNFYGSEIIRERAPKVMEIAETVADEWVKDGRFEGLPVGNPIAQMAAAKALRKAKDVEKKLEEKGVFMMAKIGLDYLKSKIEEKKRR